MKTAPFSRGVRPVFPMLLLFLGFQVNSLATNPMLLRLVASGNSMQHETVVYFDSAATTGYDPLYDAPSLGVDPGALEIVTRLNAQDYQINALPPLVQSVTVPVKVGTGISGTYQIDGNDLQSLPQGAQIKLFDSFTNTDHDLRSGSYTCFIADTESVPRFALTIITSPLPNVSSGLLDPACAASADGYLFAAGPGNGAYNYYWKDSLNNLLQVSLNVTGADTLAHVNAGFYRVDINTPGTFDNATVYFAPRGAQSARASFSLPGQQIVLSNNSATATFTNTSQNAETYWWDFGDGMGSNDEHGSNSYSQLGTYTVTLTASNSICPEVSTHSKVITVTGGTTAISSAAPVHLGYDAQGYFLSNMSGTLVSLTVFDLSGRQVSETSTSPGNYDKLYFGAGLPAGQAYMLRAHLNNNTTLSVKFIK